MRSVNVFITELIECLTPEFLKFQKSILNIDSFLKESFGCTELSALVKLLLSPKQLMIL